MPQLLISAAHKSSGKTVVSTGLCAEFAARGLAVQPFKKGPDYIDPAWLALAARRPCFNLDFNIQSAREMTDMVATRSAAADLSLIEANKGLYDGVDPGGSDSNAALAKLLGCPVVLVIDCEGITRGIAPLLQGYSRFDHGVSIAGVILNRVGGARHHSKLVAAVRRYSDLPVLGSIARDQRLEVPQRHLGLIPSGEFDGASAALGKIRAAVAEQVDVAAVLELARPKQSAAAKPAPPPAPAAVLRLGVFRDGAFSFYYPDDLEEFERCGAELVFIDGLRDGVLPPVDALFIGGGFPETRAQALENNAALRNAVHDAVEDGMPAYAECGGLMYLARSISWNNARHRMCGVIKADAVMHPSPRGRGYVEFTETEAMPWPGAAGGRAYRAHEFHYSSLVNADDLEPTAMRLARGEGIGGGRDGIVYKNLLATYLHRRTCAADRWPQRFVQFAQTHRIRTTDEHK